PPECGAASRRIVLWHASTIVMLRPDSFGTTPHPSMVRLPRRRRRIRGGGRNLRDRYYKPPRCNFPIALCSLTTRVHATVSRRWRPEGWRVKIGLASALTFRRGRHKDRVSS